MFVRVRRDFGPGVTLNVYAGVVAAAEVSVEDAQGRVLRQDDLSTGPILGANLTLRF